MKKTSLAKLHFGVTASLILATGAYIAGCGRSSIGEEDTASGAGGQRQDYLTVKGAAGFGTQCPFGSISGVKPVGLQLWDCPIGGTALELAEPIKPIFLQADCKKFYLTARTQDRSIDTMWEVFPDGTFFFTLNGIHAKIANSPATANGVTAGACTTPLATDIFGKVDCTDPDKANISFEAVMWTGKPNPTPTRSSSPIPTNSPIPGPTVTSNPVPNPSPTVAPNPTPGPTRTTSPFPFPFPFPTRLSGGSDSEGIAVVNVPVNAAVNAAATPMPTSTAPTTGQCGMPTSCYFYTRTELKQCQ